MDIIFIRINFFDIMFCIFIKYEEPYNSFTDDERKITDAYHKETFNKHKKEFL